MSKENKKIGSVDLKLYKRSVSREALFSYIRSTNCSSTNYSVQLTVFAGAGNLQLVTNTVLASTDLQRSSWIGFRGLKNIFQSIAQRNDTSKLTVKIVARSSCSNQLVNPQQLGIVAEEEATALLIVCYDSQSNSGDSLMMRLIIQADSARPRRQAEMVSSGGRDRPTFDLTEPCRLVKYNVSIVLLMVIAF